jgi:pectin methylesterase-like acyl-CoA thioesterase
MWVSRSRRATRASGRVVDLRSFARSSHAVELLEPRRLFAAHIVGSATNYATIQAAVNAAVAGQTITVDAGVYSELVTVTKQLTIKGPRAGIDGRSNLRIDRAQEAIVNGKLNSNGTRGTSFFLNADNIVLDGFTVEGQNTDSTYRSGIHMG